MTHPNAPPGLPGGSRDRPDQAVTPNLLLRHMTEDDFAAIAPELSHVRLDRDKYMVNPNEPIELIYFPEGGIVSVVSSMPDSGATEVGIFGREGFSGTTVLLGAGQSPYGTFMQVEGAAGWSLPTAVFIRLTDERPALRKLLLRYAQSFLIQTAQSAVANAHHRIETRLARWLLMCHDRLDGDQINLTHEFMSMMIAAQRTGVTLTLHLLEGAGAIRSTRGRVTIRDREKLEDLAGDAYGLPEREYQRLVRSVLYKG